tara:strand:+ start:3894 stop:4088 length:195 start_codon:yes stop_codon:yes gene_type:complete
MNNKIKLPKNVEDFFQVYAKPINGKYVYFPNVYKKLGDSMWEEVEMKNLPEGIKIYIENERNKK